MRRPLILYSTNTWLAFNIAERYYRGRHYIWCTPFFNGRSDKGEAGFVPPPSCPWEFYRSLYGEWRAGDRHSMKIAQNRDGILRGVQANRSSGVTSERREREIASIVERADIRDFEPLVYVVPLRKGARPGQGSPGRGACAPSFPGVHHREPAAKIVRYNQARIVDRLPMDWSSKMGKFLDARPRDDVVEAVYLATRVNVASRGSRQPWYFPEGTSGSISQRAAGWPPSCLGDLEKCRYRIGPTRQDSPTDTRFAHHDVVAAHAQPAEAGSPIRRGTRTYAIGTDAQRGPPRLPLLASFPRPLRDSQNLVGRHVVQRLMDAAGPGDVDFFDHLRPPQTEVHPRIARAGIAGAGGGVIVLDARIGRDAHLRPQSHAIALHAHQFQQNPMIAILRNVVEVLRLPVEHAHHGVNAPIVIHVPECHAAMRRGALEIGAGADAHVLELPVSQVAQHRVGFFRFAQRHLSDIVERVPAHRQQVLPSVIVEIGNPIRPARHGAGDGAHTGDGGDLREISRRAAILEQRKGVALEGGHPDVVVAVVVDVPEIGAHARNVSAGLGVRDSRL